MQAHPARIARELALAHALQARLDAGEFPDRADMARSLGFSRARITQILNLCLLAPDIQEEILFLEATDGHTITGHDLRPIASTVLWDEQRRQWAALRR
jgi:hypothetical protein